MVVVDFSATGATCSRASVHGCSLSLSIHNPVPIPPNHGGVAFSAAGATCSRTSVYPSVLEQLSAATPIHKSRFVVIGEARLLLILMILFE